MMQTRKPTLVDVAQVAGVSRSTASRALASHPRVSAPARARVLAVAEAMGYVANSMARNLRKQHASTIGVMVTNINNVFYSALAAGVAAECRARGMNVVLTENGSTPEREIEAARQLVSLRVGGLILTPTSPHAGEFLRSHDIAVVEVDRRFGRGQLPSVTVDNLRATREAVRGLVRLGHRRVGLLIDETHWDTGRERFQGYCDALVDFGIPVEEHLIGRSGWDAVAAQSVAEELLRVRPRPTALFAANNLLAEGAWRAAMSSGLSVPTDLSIISFDDAPWMSLVTPGLTAIAQDVEGMGKAAVQLLLDIDPDDETVLARTIEIPTTKLERGSTASPPIG